MIKIINKILFYAKIILLLIVFTVTLYISLIKMDMSGLNTWSIFPIFIPLLLVLMVFVFSFFLNVGRNNIFFNIVCVLVLLSIIMIDCRTLFDKSIISQTSISINFFNIEVNKIKTMLYLMFVSNILLIFYEKRKKMHS